MKETTLMELVDTTEPSNDFYTKTDENISRAAELESLGFHDIAKRILEDVEFKDKLNRIAQFKYLKITQDKIGQFLDKKVELYNAQHLHTGKACFLDTSFFDIARSRTSFWNPEVANAQDAVRRERERMMQAPLPEHSFIRSIRDTQYRNQVSRHTGSRIFSSGGSSASGGVGGIIVDIDSANVGGGGVVSRSTCDASRSVGIGKFQWTEEVLESYKMIPPKEVLESLWFHKERNVFDYFTIASVNEIADPLLLGKINNSADSWFCFQWGKDIALEDVL